MNKCFVKGCNSGLQTFSVEKDPATIAKWTESLAVTERPFDPNTDEVCSAHFEERLLSKEGIYILSGGELKVDHTRSKTVLLPGSVPTIFTPACNEEVKDEQPEIVEHEETIANLVPSITVQSEGDALDFGHLRSKEIMPENDTVNFPTIITSTVPFQLEKIPEKEIKDEIPSRPHSEERQTVEIMEVETPAVSEGSKNIITVPEPPKGLKSRVTNSSKPLIQVKQFAAISVKPDGSRPKQANISGRINNLKTAAAQEIVRTPSPPVVEIMIDPPEIPDNQDQDTDDKVTPPLPVLTVEECQTNYNLVATNANPQLKKREETGARPKRPISGRKKAIPRKKSNASKSLALKITGKRSNESNEESTKACVPFKTNDKTHKERQTSLSTNLKATETDHVPLSVRCRPARATKAVKIQDENFDYTVPKRGAKLERKTSQKPPNKCLEYCTEKLDKRETEKYQPLVLVKLLSTNDIEALKQKVKEDYSAASAKSNPEILKNISKSDLKRMGPPLGRRKRKRVRRLTLKRYRNVKANPVELLKNKTGKNEKINAEEHCEQIQIAVPENSGAKVQTRKRMAKSRNRNVSHFSEKVASSGEQSRYAVKDDEVSSSDTNSQDVMKVSEANSIAPGEEKMDCDSDVRSASPDCDPLSMDMEVCRSTSSDDDGTGADEKQNDSSAIARPDSPLPKPQALENRASFEKGSCFVLTCLGKSNKFFRPPGKDPVLFKKWVEQLPKRERPLRENDWICADHFKRNQIRSAIKTPWGKMLALPQYKWRLTPGAVPKIFRYPRIVLKRVTPSANATSSSSASPQSMCDSKCVVPGCKSRPPYNGFRMTFHEFPVFVNYRKLWVREISRKTGVSIPETDEFLMNKKVCGLHFVGADYRGGSRNNPLKNAAVPNKIDFVGNSNKECNISSTEKAQNAQKAVPTVRSELSQSRCSKIAPGLISSSFSESKSGSSKSNRSSKEPQLASTQEVINNIGVGSDANQASQPHQDDDDDDDIVPVFESLKSTASAPVSRDARAPRKIKVTSNRKSSVCTNGIIPNGTNPNGQPSTASNIKITSHPKPRAASNIKISGYPLPRAASKMKMSAHPQSLTDSNMKASPHLTESNIKAPTITQTPLQANSTITIVEEEAQNQQVGTPVQISQSLLNTSQQGIYVFSQTSGILQRLQLIPSAFPTVPMFTIVEPQPPQPGLSTEPHPLPQNQKQQLSAPRTARILQKARPRSRKEPPGSVANTVVEKPARSDEVAEPSTAGASISLPSPTRPTSTPSFNSKTMSKGTTICVNQKRSPAKSPSMPQTQNHHQQRQQTFSNTKSDGITNSASKKVVAAAKRIPTKSPSVVPTQPRTQKPANEACTSTPTEIPPNKMKVFKKSDTAGKYVITRKGGKTVVTPYDGEQPLTNIKDTFVTPNLGKLVFPSPKEGESIMVIVPSSVPMVGIGNSSRRSDEASSLSKPASIPRGDPKAYPVLKQSSTSENGVGAGVPAETLGTTKSPAASKEAGKDANFGLWENPLDTIYERKRFLKLPDEEAWTIQLLKQKKGEMMEKFIFIAETVLKSDKMVQQRLLKVRENLKFELFVNGKNLTSMFNEKDDPIHSFSVLQELLDNFAAFNVCVGIDGFDEIPESSCTEAHRVGSAWYSKKCESLCLDTTACVECASLLGVLNLLKQNSSASYEPNSFQTEVIFLNNPPEQTSTVFPPELGLNGNVSLMDHSDLISVSKLPTILDNGRTEVEHEEPDILSEPVHYEVVAANEERIEYVQTGSPTNVPVATSSCNISPTQYVLGPVQI